MQSPPTTFRHSPVPPDKTSSNPPLRAVASAWPPVSTSCVPLLSGVLVAVQNTISVPPLKIVLIVTPPE